MLKIYLSPINFDAAAIKIKRAVIKSLRVLSQCLLALASGSDCAGGGRLRKKV